MDRQLIKSLIDALASSDLTELEYSSGGATLRLSKGARAPVSQPAADPAPPASEPAPPPPAPEPRGAAASSGVVAAPLFGIVHLHRSPGTPPLVTAGQAVAAGQVLCLIEAMKVFTELRAEQAGTVAAVLVETGQEVEAGQALFRLEA